MASLLPQPLSAYKDFVALENAIKEKAANTKDPNELAKLVKAAYETPVGGSKVRVAKLVRKLLEDFSALPGALQQQVQATKDAVQWAKDQNRVFLRQALEGRLISFLKDAKQYSEAIALIATLLKELKRLDDKAILVEVQLVESQVYHALRNLPKARASLTAARTSATSIYCPPDLQAAIDMQSGILHGEEKDYKTAYSYFFETLEGYSGLEDPRAVLALKYMLLCKVMLNLSDEVPSLATSKLAIKFSGRDIEAMKAVALAYQHRSLQELDTALQTYKAETTDDPIVYNQLRSLYDSLLEANLLRLTEPFSVVQIDHIATLIKIDRVQVERTLSKMILDKTLMGVLDQGVDELILFDSVPEDPTYVSSLDIIGSMDKVVGSLFSKANLIY